MNFCIRLLILLFLCSVAKAGNVVQGLCAHGEISYFTCQAGQKWIGLCASAKGQIQYRYGTGGKRVFRYPDSTVVDSATLFRMSSYSRYQTERTEISFANHGFAYALFDYSEDDGSRHSGVRVTTPLGVEKLFYCTGLVSSNLNALKSVLRCDPDNALGGGECP